MVNNDVSNRVADCSAIVINWITYFRFNLRFSTRVHSQLRVLLLWQIKNINNDNCYLETIIRSQNFSVNVEVVYFLDDEDNAVFMIFKTLRILKMVQITHENSFRTS
jgi:hypothetical protein